MPVFLWGARASCRSAGAVTSLFYGYANDAQHEGNSGNAGFPSDVSFIMPISGELAYDAFCQGGFNNKGVPQNCTYGTWNYTGQINPTLHQPQGELSHCACRGSAWGI